MRTCAVVVVFVLDHMKAHTWADRRASWLTHGTLADWAPERQTNRRTHRGAEPLELRQFRCFTQRLAAGARDWELLQLACHGRCHSRFLPPRSCQTAIEARAVAGVGRRCGPQLGLSRADTQQLPLDLFALCRRRRRRRRGCWARERGAFDAVPLPSLAGRRRRTMHRSEPLGDPLPPRPLEVLGGRPLDLTGAARRRPPCQRRTLSGGGGSRSP